MYDDDKTCSASKADCNLASMKKLHPQLYACSAGTGQAFWALLHTITESLTPIKLSLWDQMISKMIAGVYPCKHCRNDFHRCVEHVFLFDLI